MLYWLFPLLESGDMKALLIIVITIVYSFIYMVLQFRVFLYEKLEQNNLLQQVKNLLIFENYTIGFRMAYSGGWYEEQIVIAMVLFVPMSLFWVDPNTKYFERRLKLSNYKAFELASHLSASNTNKTSSISHSRSQQPYSQAKNPVVPNRNRAITHPNANILVDIPNDNLHPPIPVEIEDKYRYPMYDRTLLESTPINKDVICSGNSFLQHFIKDIGTFNQSLVIYSPFITETRLQMLLPYFDKAISQRKQIVVVTKDITRRKKEERSKYTLMESVLRKHGVRVVYQGDMHEKLIFIDQDAVWVGSLNALSFTGSTGEVMHRHADKKTVAEYAKIYHIGGF